MSNKWDTVFEATQQDGWWMPKSVIQVSRADIRYTYDTLNNPRYSMVTRVSPQLDDYSELVDEVVRHQEPTGEASFMIAQPSYSAQLERQLEASGFTLAGRADCRSIDVNAPRPPLPKHIEVKRAETLETLRQMDSVMVACFEHATPADEATLTHNLAQCTGPDARCRCYIAYDTRTGEALSVGAFNRFSEHNVGFMWGGATMPQARGRGVYSAVVTARMTDAKALGLQRIGLYAIQTTSGPIMERQGFEKHGPVHFWKQTYKND